MNAGGREYLSGVRWSAFLMLSCIRQSRAIFAGNLEKDFSGCDYSHFVHVLGQCVHGFFRETENIIFMVTEEKV